MFRVILQSRFLASFIIAACQLNQAHALSLLGGGYSEHLPFIEFYSSLPYDEVKQCVLRIHLGSSQPVKVKTKKGKESVIEQLEFDKYGFEMIEFEKGTPYTRIKARQSDGFIRIDRKTGKPMLAYEQCTGSIDDQLAASSFADAAANLQPTKHLYETKFSPAEILTCMSAYPGKLLDDYEASYYGTQITAYSKGRFRIGWARARSMSLAQQKFYFDHFILTDGSRTLVGFDGGSKAGFTAADRTPAGDKSWVGSLARSCATFGDDRDVVYWPRHDK